MTIVARHSPYLGMGAHLIRDYVGGLLDQGYNMEILVDDEWRKEGSVAVYYRPQGTDSIRRDLCAGVRCFVIQDEHPVALPDGVIGNGEIATVPFNLHRDRIVDALAEFIDLVEGEV